MVAIHNYYEVAHTLSIGSEISERLWMVFSEH